MLDYAKGSYKGKETLKARFYTITLSGGGGFPCTARPKAPEILDFLKIPARHLGFGQDSLNAGAVRSEVLLVAHLHGGVLAEDRPRLSGSSWNFGDGPHGLTVTR